MSDEEGVFRPRAAARSATHTARKPRKVMRRFPKTDSEKQSDADAVEVEVKINPELLGDQIITRTTTVERVVAAPPTRSKADSAKVAKAARELIADLRDKRDSLPHGV